MVHRGEAPHSPRKKTSRFKNYTDPLLSETVICHAAQALGRGFDVSNDFRLGFVKGAIGSHLVELGDETQDLITPTGFVIHNVPKDIRLDKGERTRFKSDVLSFSQMSERFNQGVSLRGSIPLGLFNAMYGFNGPWQTDANATKSLVLDGWFLTLYSLHLTKSPLELTDDVKEAVPSGWEPRALARFIKNYGTHIIVSVKVGGKNIVYVRQHSSSPLPLTEVASLTQNYADERFEALPDSPPIVDKKEKLRKDKVSPSFARANSFHSLRKSTSYNTRENYKDDVQIICRRRGGDDTVEKHYDWIATVADSPDVISMSFVPINSVLEGISGVGFLSYAINLYLRYRPPVEELEAFLEFQVPKQWSPTFVGSPCKEPAWPALQFNRLGPKLYVSTSQVCVGRKPVTGVRLFLEGTKCNRLAIHLQHLSVLPRVLQLWNTNLSIPALWKEPDKRDSRWFAPVQRKGFSHVDTWPVECSESWIGATGIYIVTGAQLQVWDFEGNKKVLFLRLLYTKVPGSSIRMSQWDHTPATATRSGHIYDAGLNSPLQRPCESPDDFVNFNGGIDSAFPSGPKSASANPRLLTFVDNSEMSKGPQDLPGHWLVTGAKLDVDTGKIGLRVKYSLLHYEGEQRLPSSSSSS